ncbi:MAG: YgaP family membrane protein [Elusimicrobiota bacterium]
MMKRFFKEDRVRRHTAASVNEKIDRKTERDVFDHAGRDREQISRRIESLRQEWDVERVLEANASVLALTGVALGALIHRRWLFLSAGVLAFLFQHAVQGWCPPIPAFRRMGVRTRQEIDREVYALKFLRGDFDRPAAARPPEAKPAEALRASAG